MKQGLNMLIIQTHLIFFSHCLISPSLILSTLLRIPKAINVASFGPNINFIMSCLMNYQLVFSSCIFTLLLVMDSMVRSYLSRLNHCWCTCLSVIFAAIPLTITVITFELYFVCFVLLLFDILLQNRLFFNKLNPLLSTFIQTLLGIFNHQTQHLGNDVQIANFVESLQTLEKFLAFLQLTQLLNSISIFLFLGSGKRKCFIGDGVDAANLFKQLLVAFGGILHAFLMFLDELVALLKCLLVAQQSLFVLPDDVL